MTDANFTGRVANTKAYAIDMAPTGGRTDALTATRVSGSEGQGIGTHIPLGGGHVPSVDFASAG